MKQAVEHMEWSTPQGREAYWELVRAIAEAEKQEHVANYCKECLTYNGHHEGCSHYTSPPQRQWVGLTDEEWTDEQRVSVSLSDFRKRIEEKFKEKNT